MTFTRNLLPVLVAALGCAAQPSVAFCAAPQTQGSAAARFTLDIKPQPLDDAISEFAQQSGLQVVFNQGVGKGMMAPAVVGSFSAEDALAKLLQNTALQYRFLDRRTIAIVPKDAGEPKAVPGPASAAASASTAGVRLALQRAEGVDEVAAGSALTEEDFRGAPEMLVRGSRSQNTDIQRTEDDPQPYVVFDREDIQRSMATDLESFLKARLPMNQSRASEGQNVTGTRGNQSTIDLRGLGANQTLILVNGRRMPGIANATDIYQPDINGIPLSAVERIEILPSTAGGIYGGGATGGVVNVILKRDYQDLELTARYDGTFAGGGAQRRLDGTAGFTLEGGRTSVMVMGSYRDGNPLYIGDRDLLARTRYLQDRNNHAFYTSTTTPVHGYTTNIVSRNGNPLVLKDGMRSLNSRIAFVPVGYQGPDSDNGAAFLGTAGRYNLEPADDVLGNGYALLQTPEVRSLQLSVRREFTDRIEAYVDATRFDNHSMRAGSPGALTLATVDLPAGPNNPFVQAVRLSVPLAGFDSARLRSDTGSVSEQLNGGAIVRLPGRWTAQAEYSLGRSKSTYRQPYDVLTADGYAALTDGRLDPLSDVNAHPLDFSGFDPGGNGSDTESSNPLEQKDATLRISGPLVTLPGGPLRLAALLERREQYTGDQIFADRFQGNAPVYTFYPAVGSSTDSAYAELNAPLIRPASARPGLLGLDLRASYRLDVVKTRTREFGDGFSYVTVPSRAGPFPDLPFQTNRVQGNQYTLGLRYTPVQSVAFRASYGEGILPPTPTNLSEMVLDPGLLPFFVGDVADPDRGGLPVDAATIQRYTLFGSLALRPEQSASWSGGVILTPDVLSGLRVSVDYTRIEKTDEIGSLDTQTLLNQEDDFPGMIVRNALTPADAALGYTRGTIRELNTGPVNIAKSLMEAIDIQADYRWDTHLGSFAANVVATVQPRLSQQAVPGGAEIDKVGFHDGPLKWRGNMGLRWSRGPLELGWDVQYFDASWIYNSTDASTARAARTLNQGSARIPAQSYHDLYGRYRFDGAHGSIGGLLQNSEIALGIQNVLDASPPLITFTSFVALGSYATEGDPRLRRYSVSFTRRFGQ